MAQAQEITVKEQVKPVDKSEIEKKEKEEAAKK